MVEQLQDVRADQNSKYINYQNEGANPCETEIKSMITDDNFAPENISAESPKERKMTTVQRNGQKKQFVFLATLF